MKNKIITIIRVVLTINIVLIIVYSLFYWLPPLAALFVICFVGLIAIELFEDDVI